VEVPRMTTRRWMIGVACVALMIGYLRPVFQTWRMADYHRRQQMRPLLPTSESWHRFHVRRRWHAEMEEKYRRAIWLPWRTIELEPLPP
jgi:hypothetical protein